MSTIIRLKRSPLEKYTLMWFDGYWRKTDNNCLYPGGTPEEIIDGMNLDFIHSMASNLYWNFEDLFSDQAVHPSIISLLPKMYSWESNADLMAIKREYFHDDGILDRGRLIHSIVFNATESNLSLISKHLYKCHIITKDISHYINYDAYQWEVRRLLDYLHDLSLDPVFCIEEYFEAKGFNCVSKSNFKKNMAGVR